MRKLQIAVLGVILVFGAWAADVAERASCTDIKTEMDALAANDARTSDEDEHLAELRKMYRGQCTARTSGRGARTIAKTRTPVTNDATENSEEVKEDAEEVIVAEKCDTPDANGCCPGEEFADMGADGKFCCKGEMCFPPMKVEPQKSEEEIAAEIAANIEKGLCGDGSVPNKYGCCPGEIFKDMGDKGFNCCPKSGGDCFPPMK